MVQMLRFPRSADQYATRRPCGDQSGWTASPLVTRRVSPVSTLTAQSALVLDRLFGLSTIRSVANTTSLPSGAHEGLKPKAVSLRTDSPVAPMIKIPPPDRSERKAM